MMERSPQPAAPLWQSLRKLIGLMTRRRKLQLVALIGLMLIGALAEMATLGAVLPFLALLAGAHAGAFPLPGMSISLTVETASLLFAAVALSAAGVRIFVLWSGFRFTYGLGADLGSEVYRRTLYQPYSWHVGRNSSEILSGISKVNEVVTGIINPMMQGGVAALVSAGIAVMLLAIDARVAIAAMASMGFLYGVSTVIIRRRIRAYGRTVADNATQRVKAVQEGLGGIRDVLLDGVQPIYHRRFAGFDRTMRNAQARINLCGNAPRYLVEAAGMVCIVALAYWLSQRQGGLLGAIPLLGALAIGAQRLLPQAQILYLSWSQVSSTRAQLEDVLQLATLPMPIARNPSIAATAVPVANVPLIELRDVVFRYSADGVPVLDEVNLTIPRGSRVGIAGRTGSGKSTLVDLVMGLLEPTEGAILVDGNRLDQRNCRHWQERIAHVPQSIFLSDTSIAENIAFGVPPDAIDMARVRKAATMAQAKEFIEALPDQYLTAVGERGVRLSGGQRQRLGLARALYKDVDVLVLDEATSALDDATEAAVVRSIEALGGHITVLMIAHRLSTLSNCDRMIDFAACGPVIACRPAILPGDIANS